MTGIMPIIDDACHEARYLLSETWRWARIIALRGGMFALRMYSALVKQKGPGPIKADWQRKNERAFRFVLASVGGILFCFFGAMSYVIYGWWGVGCTDPLAKSIYADMKEDPLSWGDTDHLAKGNIHINVGWNVTWLYSKSGNLEFSRVCSALLERGKDSVEEAKYQRTRAALLGANQ